ncbi:MAG: NUDIX hydrolase [Verrucomicrobiota bacterium]|nr:NUDIX hydrolase [Verrucomicrobiota bacterium]
MTIVSGDSGPTPPPWESVGELQVVADCRVFNIIKQRWRHPLQRVEDDFYLIRCRNWVVAIALTADNQLLLVQQFRFGAGMLVWEFPAGCIDAGEDPIHAATRELAEETGFAGENPRILGVSRPNPALQDNWCYFVLFQNAVQKKAPTWQDHEEMVLRLEPVEKLINEVRNGQLNHALVANALLLVQPLVTPSLSKVISSAS